MLNGIKVPEYGYNQVSSKIRFQRDFVSKIDIIVTLEEIIIFSAPVTCITYILRRIIYAFLITLHINTFNSFMENANFYP